MDQVLKISDEILNELDGKLDIKRHVLIKNSFKNVMKILNIIL